MTQTFDLIVRAGICVTPAGTLQTDIGIRDGRFAAIGDLGNADAAESIEAEGLHVLPGVIDSHVHFREPGMEHLETIEAGSRGAVLGGVTAVFDMANNEPPISSKETVDWKREFVRGRTWCDMGFFVAAMRGNIAELAELEIQPGVCGIKVMAGSSLVPSILIEDDETLEAVMRSGFRRVSYHSEDEYRIRERKARIEEGAPYAAHADVQDAEVAFRCTRRLMTLAAKTGRRAHIVHVTTAEEMAFLGGWRDLCTVEVLPVHLTLVGPEAYERLGGFAVTQPPVRDQHHFEALWAGVRDGTVDTLATDHAPHAREDKERPYPLSPAGLTAVQTFVPVMLDHVNAGRLSLERLVDLTSAGPARVFGVVGKGRIALSYDADLTIVDLKARNTITNDWIVSVCGWTPFDGVTVDGWPTMTVICGRVVMRDGELLAEPAGEMVRFGDCLRTGAS